MLTADDLAMLRAAGVGEVIIAQLEENDVSEDAAAARIAERLAGANVRVSAAFTGRANLYSTADGLTQIDPAFIHGLNGIDEAIAVATLTPFAPVVPRQMLATVKIIPFAAPREAVERAERLLSGDSAMSVAPFGMRKVALILTTLSNTRPALLEKTRNAIDARIRAVGSQMVMERHVEHSVDELAAALRDAAADLILIFGASAITDRRDVIPSAIEKAGGTVVHFGMPVDPGNLLLVARLGQADVIGLPGCARSPKLNGFDFVLWRLAAGLSVGPKEIAAMGVGGLLSEIPLRPQPRDEPSFDVPRDKKIGAIVLAAGTSSRMGANKLLADVSGTPMVRRAADAALASTAEPVIVVTGNQSEKVRAALSGQDVEFADNPAFVTGLSSSLRRGLSALPEDCDGAIILLGDMPDVSAGLIDKLIAAFDPEADHAICIATWHGKRGNPVLFGRRFFAEMQAIEGDVGARGLIGAYPDLVCEVEADSDAPLIDIDTPKSLAAYRKEHG